MTDKLIGSLVVNVKFHEKTSNVSESGETNYCELSDNHVLLDITQNISNSWTKDFTMQ